MCRIKEVNLEPAPYKIVEVATVTDEELERVINEWVGKGYAFEEVKFAMRDASKRPAMAFVFFTAEKKG